MTSVVVAKHHPMPFEKEPTAMKPNTPMLTQAAV